MSKSTYSRKLRVANSSSGNIESGQGGFGHRIAMLSVVAIIGLRWFFEGIAGGRPAEIVLLTFGVGWLALDSRTRARREGTVWVLYLLAIVMSLVLHGMDSRIMRCAIIVVLLVFIHILDCGPVQSYVFAIRAISVLGFVNASSIVAHAVLGTTFNNILFPLFSDSARDLASYYFNRGNFYGFNCYPTDAAVLVACSLAIGVITFSEQSNLGLGFFTSVPSLVLYAIAILLTGKKGILFCSALSLIAVILIRQGSQKNLGRFVVALVLFAGLAATVWYMALNNPDNPLFRRLSTFLTLLLSSGDYDSGRFRLITEALDLWRTQPWTGIGWRRFAEYSVVLFGHTRTHEVNCDYVQFLCETGVIGFVLMIMPILLMVRRSFIVLRALKSSPFGERDDSAIVFSVFTLFFVTAYAFLEIPFYDMPVFGIYLIGCCTINAAYRQAVRTMRISTPRSRSHSVSLSGTSRRCQKVSGVTNVAICTYHRRRAA